MLGEYHWKLKNKEFKLLKLADPKWCLNNVGVKNNDYTKLPLINFSSNFSTYILLTFLNNHLNITLKRKKRPFSCQIIEC